MYQTEGVYFGKAHLGQTRLIGTSGLPALSYHRLAMPLKRREVKEGRAASGLVLDRLLIRR